MSNAKILFQLSGSIACFKACALLSKLVQAGFDLEVVATESALRFVGEATLEGLTGKPVHRAVFAPGHYMDHIHLMKWADLVVLCPATANTLNKMAGGIGDDIVTTLFLAHDFKKPFLVAPAMNVNMYRHPATQKSLAVLSEWGINVLPTGAGHLACGDQGEGRLLEPDVVFQAIQEQIKNSLSPTTLATKQSTRSLEILITSGGTEEPLDGVRSITNFSTGRTGAAIATHFTERGHRVTYLHANRSALPSKMAGGNTCRMLEFRTFNDLERRLKDELGTRSFDAVLHLAAVSDYSVDSIQNGAGLQVKTGTGKIDSADSLTIQLKKNSKLIDSLRAMSRNQHVRVVAFKLTNTDQVSERLRAVEKLGRSAQPDLIVQNDLTDIDVRGSHHESRLFVAPFSASAEPIAQTSTKKELAETLELWLTQEKL